MANSSRPFPNQAGRQKAPIPTFDDVKAMWAASGLRGKILFTILALALYRFAVLVPVWGVDANMIQVAAQQSGGALLGFIDMFSGGALTSVSVIALGIGPYITSSIVMQLMTVVIPRLEELQKEEGESGRRKIAQYTRYLTVILAIFQSILVLKFIGSVPGAIAVDNMALFYPMAVLAMTAGAIFALWLSELITERGIGNGGSLLILAGILSRLPMYAQQTYELVYNNQEKSFGLLVLLAIYLVIIAAVVVLQEATRKIMVVSAKRQVGANRMAGGQSTHIPFKINPAGVMPIIFAFAVLSFPSTIIQVIQQNQPTGILQEVVLFWGRYMAPGSVAYIVIEFTLIVFFTFFYASIIPSMQPKQIAEQLKKYGNAIPGLKPGRPTAEKLEEILSRTTFIGAIAIGVITLVASSITSITGITTLYLGATSLIIMVGVALDTMNQIRTHLLARQYEGFLKS
ncbi:MAG: preprotein translocase subunit SecY [Vampirovibrionales bacterium]|nr:preprotein translocase subunit SecY [Vampirovibrionales bacterium]